MQQTEDTGFVTLHLALQPGDTTANTYDVMATFNGTNPRSASINASDPYGDQYAVCTTNQYGLLPSTNSSTLSVLLQATDAITAAQTAKQMQQEAESEGLLDTWVGPGDSWCTWFKMHVRVHVDSLNFTMSAWVGFPIGAGLDEFSGFQNVFVQAFQGVPDGQVSSYEETLVNTIASAAAIFVGGMTATFFLQGNPYYPVALGVYAAGMIVAIEAVKAFADESLSRTVLLGIGGALLGFVVSLLDLPCLLDQQAQLASAPPFSGLTQMGTEGVLETYNCFINDILKQIALAFGFGCWLLNWPFSVVTAFLALLALTLSGCTNVQIG
jgi:hypothetical protein